MRGEDHLRAERSRAERVGQDLSAPVAVTHFFSSPGRRPDAIVQELRNLGVDQMIVDEELTGDGYWHVAAFATCLLTTSEADGVEHQMEQVAQADEATYDGWKVSLTAGEAQHLHP